MSIALTLQSARPLLPKAYGLTSCAGSSCRETFVTRCSIYPLTTDIPRAHGTILPARLNCLVRLL